MELLQGFVEKIRPEIIEGWTTAMGSPDTPVFELTAGEWRIVFQPENWPRHDVADALGQSFLDSGFRWIPDPIASPLIRAALVEGTPIDISVNGQPLPAAPVEMLPAPLRGFVEKIRPEVIGGWTNAMCLEDPPVFELTAGECRIAFQPECRTRRDVADAYGESFLDSGFSWSPGPVANALIRAALGSGIPIEITVNGELLASEPLAQLSVQTLGNDLLPEESIVGPARAFSWGLFRIQGMAPPEVAISLRRNGVDVGCLISRDSRQKQGAPVFPFELEIPPTIWPESPAGQPVEFDLLFDGTVAITLTLDGSVLSCWLKRIASLQSERDRQYLGLLALEHLRASRLHEQIDPPALEVAAAAARSMRLQDFAFPEGPPCQGPGLALTRPPSTLAMERAMRDLNDTLGMAPAHKPLSASVSEVLSRQMLSGEPYVWFSSLAVQLACERGDFHALLPMLDPKFLDRPKDAKAPDHQSLALPVLLARGKLADAVITLRNLTHLQREGWLHTSCVQYALGEARRMLSAGLADASDVNALLSAFIGFVDETNGDWFTRHHDTHIVRTMASELACSDTLPDRNRTELVSAAIRNFGLNPTFWEALDNAGGAQSDDAVLHARRLFHDIETFIEGDRLRSGNLGHAARALRWFLKRGNADARVCSRELLVASLPHADEDTLPHLKELFEALLDASGRECLRLVFMPGLAREVLHRLLQGAEQNLSHVLRCEAVEGHECSRQQYAAAAALAEAIAAEGEARRHTLRDLESRAAQFASPESRALGFDLFVSAALLAKDAGLPWYHSLAQARRLALATLAESRTDTPLPAALLAGISRLSAHGDPEFVATAREVSRLAHARTERELVGITPAGRAAECGYGWPQDTIFIVFPSHFRGHALEDARLGWQRELTERGVKCLFLLEGENVALDEDRLGIPPGAPAAVLLEVFRWVLAHTGMQYLVLVDEHCDIHVQRFLDSLLNRKYHYYGRKLCSAPGYMQRTGSDGRLDRSPEPSEWIDGNGAVSLSRAALESIFLALDRTEGQRLLACSRDHFKLLGDLLALECIAPEDEGYFYCHRETAPGGRIGRGQGENAVLPGPSSPTMVFRAANTAERARQMPDEAWPPRIWPTCDVPSLSRNANQLEVLSDSDKVRRVLTEPVAVIAVVRNEMTMLPHFLAHYRALGVRAFLITDNGSDDGTLDYLAAQHDVMLFSTDTEYRHSHFGVSWQQAMLGNYCLGKWVIVADADEFLVYRDCETRPIGDFIDELARQGCNAAAVYMIDMYPWADLGSARFDQGNPFSMAPWFDESPLIELRFGGGKFSNSRNFVSALRHRLAPTRINAYVSQKFAVFRYAPWVRLGEGLHYASNLRAAEYSCFFAHFKYHAGFAEKVATEVHRRQHFNDAEEYALYAGMLAEGGGNFGVEGISTRYEGSQSFFAIFERGTEIP